jgi:molecular chaperone GrpE
MATTDPNTPATDAAAADTLNPGDATGDPTADLARDLAEARGQAQRLHDQWLRSQAEMENLRKRSAREMDGARKFALEQFAGALLNVMDSMELGLSAARDTQDIATLREGMELTRKQMQQVLEKFHILEVDPVGKAFNPELHQAMMTQASAEYPPNTVLSVLTKGYTLNDRLLRPAIVIVSKAPGN